MINDEKWTNCPANEEPIQPKKAYVIAEKLGDLLRTCLKYGSVVWAIWVTWMLLK